MLNAETFKKLLRDAVSELSAEQLKGTAGLVRGYGGVRFNIPEDEFISLGLGEGINSETASDIFNKGVSQICKQMVESGSDLTDEMVIAACGKIAEELETSEGDHIFVFLMPDIILTVDKPIEIGSALLRNATKADADLLEGRANVFVERMAGLQGPLDKNDFLKRYIRSTLIEVRFAGCHFRDEISTPCELAWKEIRRVAAFLRVCKEMLRLPEAHADRGLDPGHCPWHAFMVGKRGRAPLLPIYSHGSQFYIGGLEFAIDLPVLNQVKKYCHLESFNLLCRTPGELRDKVFRSLDWFLKGCNEEDPTDRLVCFFISLESLMSMGSDALSSQTDDLAENIALLIHEKESDRLEEKTFFKKKVYPLRNRVMHHGHTFDPKDVDISARLWIYITYGLIGILRHLDAIPKAGNLRSFFERAKLRAPL